jgi:hypothetical protein
MLGIRTDTALVPLEDPRRTKNADPSLSLPQPTSAKLEKIGCFRPMRRRSETKFLNALRRLFLTFLFACFQGSPSAGLRHSISDFANFGRDLVVEITNVGLAR